MATIREVKKELRHREWAEQIQECQSSGMTVSAWCKEKWFGVRFNTNRKRHYPTENATYQNKTVIPMVAIVSKLPLFDNRKCEIANVAKAT